MKRTGNESSKLHPRRVRNCTTFGGHSLHPKSTENNSAVVQFLTFTLFLAAAVEMPFSKYGGAENNSLKPPKWYRKCRSGIYVYIYTHTYPSTKLDYEYAEGLSGLAWHTSRPCRMQPGLSKVIILEGRGPGGRVGLGARLGTEWQGFMRECLKWPPVICLTVTGGVDWMSPYSYSRIWCSNKRKKCNPQRKILSQNYALQ